MLIHGRVTPQQYVSSTHLYTWVERDNVRQSISPKEKTRGQGLGIEPPTFRSEVQRTNRYTTAPPTYHANAILKGYLDPCEPNMLKLGLVHVTAN